jgi:hypothetical protein
MRRSECCRDLPAKYKNNVADDAADQWSNVKFSKGADLSETVKRGIKSYRRGVKLPHPPANRSML